MLSTRIRMVSVLAAVALVPYLLCTFSVLAAVALVPYLLRTLVHVRPAKTDCSLRPLRNSCVPQGRLLLPETVERKRSSTSVPWGVGGVRTQRSCFDRGLSGPEPAINLTLKILGHADNSEHK